MSRLSRAYRLQSHRMGICLHKGQQGAALLMVLVMILSMSLLLPKSFEQLAQGYDLASMTLEKERVKQLLHSVLNYASKLSTENCFNPQSFTVSSNTQADYRIEIRCDVSAAKRVIQGTVHYRYNVLHASYSDKVIIP